jgi:CRISPR-associated protein Cas6
MPIRDDIIDLVFPLAGRSIPALHGLPLAQALLGLAPWLEEEPLAGIHPVRGAPTEHGELLLSRRATLVLRLPAHRVHDALTISGQTIRIDDHSLAIGSGKTRPLTAHSAVSARMVAASSPDEALFAVETKNYLAAKNIHCPLVVGYHHTIPTPHGPVTAFQLALYNLADEESLTLQGDIMGAHRLQGCGIFPPHKSFAAVGS